MTDLGWPPRWLPSPEVLAGEEPSSEDVEPDLDKMGVPCDVLGCGVVRLAGTTRCREHQADQPPMIGGTTTDIKAPGLEFRFEPRIGGVLFPAPFDPNEVA